METTLQKPFFPHVFNESPVAFHGDPDLKGSLLLQLKKHLHLDQIIQGGFYYSDIEGIEGERGCAIGCTLHSDNHNLYESHYGYPVFLAYLIDSIFEGMHPKSCPAFTVKTVEVVSPGVDLVEVTRKFFVELMTSKDFGFSGIVFPHHKKYVDYLVQVFRATGDFSALATAPDFKPLWDHLNSFELEEADKFGTVEERMSVRGEIAILELNLIYEHSNPSSHPDFDVSNRMMESIDHILDACTLTKNSMLEPGVYYSEQRDKYEWMGRRLLELMQEAKPPALEKL